MEGFNVMTPFQRFRNGLLQIRGDTNELLDEMIAFAEVMANKRNTVELDENGFFYVQSSGPLEEVLAVMHKQVEKLERIKKQKDEQT
jgi:hypothetical protein